MRTQVLAAAFCVLATSVARAQDAVSSADKATYPDVPRGHWAEAAVVRLSMAGIIEGLPDGSFGGKRVMTRYEYIVTLARLVDNRICYLPTPESDAAQAARAPAPRSPQRNDFQEPQGGLWPEFADVPRDHWAHAAVVRAAQLGLVEGLPNGRFDGASPMTRGASAVCVARLLLRLKDSTPDTEQQPQKNAQGHSGIPFRDWDVAAKHWASAAIYHAANAGVFEGLPDGHFHGARPLSRYELVVTVARLLEGVALTDY